MSAAPASSHSQSMTPPDDPRSMIPVTLVIPVRNEEATVRALMESIGAQSAAPAQVVFVDAGSTDRTVEILEERASIDSRYSVVVADGAATPGVARNLGVASARHEWIAMTDAGITLEPTWLQRLWEAHLADDAAEVVYGNYEFDLRSFFEECAAVAYGVPKQQTPAGLCRGPAVVSCLIRRRAYDSVGGFVDLRAGEDEIFVKELDDSGVRAVWAPQATVWWRLRPDMPSTFERFRLYSYHYSMAGGKEIWHYPLRRSYAPVAGAILLSSVHSRRWLLVAGATIGSRVALRLRRHHNDRSWAWLLRPDRVALVTLLVVSNDAAAALGWWQAERTVRTSQSLEQGKPPSCS
jgi:glycosyltransferase involved in cell wall biosynthesis